MPDERDRGAMIDPARSNHAHLRGATRRWHLAVDAYYTAHDLAARSGLTAFLLGHACAVPPLERAIEASGAAAALGDWERRRRAASLEADLSHLGLPMPPPEKVPDLPTSLHGIGALYVLEGAKLGGRVLLRQVATSPDPEVRAARRFLEAFDTNGWRDFLVMLNRLPTDAAARRDLVAGASAAFALFLPGSKRTTVIDPAVVRPGFDLVQSNEP